MAQSLSKILLHVVFSTKYRADLIPDECKTELHGYLASSCRAMGSHAYRVGGTRNHIHIACRLPRTLAVSELLEGIKSPSSRWMKTRSPRCSSFEWQRGYGAFSLGQSQLDTLIAYIDNQEQHHQVVGFEDEMREHSRRYDIDCDEVRVWD